PVEHQQLLHLVGQRPQQDPRSRVRLARATRRQAVSETRRQNLRTALFLPLGFLRTFSSAGILVAWRRWYAPTSENDRCSLEEAHGPAVRSTESAPDSQVPPDRGPIRVERRTVRFDRWTIRSFDACHGPALRFAERQARFHCARIDQSHGFDGTASDQAP